MSQNVPSEDIGAIAQILLSLGLIDIEQSQASLLTDDLANVVLKLLLEVPNCSAKLPPKIPENNASRVRLCVEMAEQLKKLGFQRKLGFQSFIYPDAHEAKAILLFLIEQIPRSKLDEKEEISGQKIDTSVGIFDKKVKFALEKALLDPWVPSNPKLHTGKKFGIENISIPWDYLDEDNSKSAEFEFYVDHCFKALQEQVSSEQALFCSAIHLVAKFKAAEKEQQENLFFKTSSLFLSSDRTNSSTVLNSKRINDTESKFVAKSSAFMRKQLFEMDTKSAIQVSSNSSQEILQQEPNDRQNSVGISKKDDRKNSKESELNSLKEMLLRQVSIREKFEKGLERADKEIQKAKESISNEEKMLTEMKASLLSKVRSIKLLPESQGSIEKLENAKFESEERMKVMIAEWNSIKQSLEERVKYLENRLNERKDNCRKKLNQMQTMRDEISNMQKQFTIRENTLKELTEQLSNEERQANRQFYVDRIFNIVKTLRDQKQQIDKEIVDIRSLQKDINYRSGVSSRNWKMVTDLVYKATQSKDTTKSSSLQQTFDHLLALQKIFDEIVTLLHDIGSTRNDCRDLKIKIESIDTNSLTSKSKKLSQDLAAIRKSNQV